jgi:hypothetical protein
MVPTSLGAAIPLLPLYRHVEVAWQLWKARNVQNLNLPCTEIGDLNTSITKAGL